MSLVLFHRSFQKFQGGHLKVFHYFQHVRSSPRHQARISFTADSLWDETNPWSDLRDPVTRPGEELAPDVQFLAGVDWRSIDPEARRAPTVPVINLIQDFRALRRDGPLHPFLAHRAVRICVSPQIAEALSETGTVDGPILTIPISIDLEQLPSSLPPEQRDVDCVVLALKDPPLGAAIAGPLRKAGYRVTMIDRPVARVELLEAMARARVSVHLPAPVEGAYMPALECMALGTAVICPDCVGNRSFCRDGETAIVPRYRKRAILNSARLALGTSQEELQPMLTGAREESLTRGLDSERERFIDVLDRVHEIWDTD